MFQAKRSAYGVEREGEGQSRTARVRADRQGCGKEYTVGRAWWVAGVCGVLCILVAVHLVGADQGGNAAPNSSGNSSRTPLRPPAALAQAIELYQRGEYEAAAPLFEQAEKGHMLLSATDLKRLQDYSKRNRDALAARTEARKLLEQAEAAYRAGRYQEAERLVARVKANQFLAAEDRQRVVQLADQLSQRTRRWWLLGWDRSATTKDAAASLTPEQMMSEARKALNQQDYEQAEAWARAAQQAGYRAYLPWQDTPAKIIAEAQRMRARQTPAGKTEADTSPEARARTLLAQAREAIKQGDLALARQRVRQAEELKADLHWWEELTPEKVKTEIARAEAQASLQGKAGATNPDMLKPDEVRALLRDARKALAENQLDRAEELARQARLATQVKYGLFEDTPDRVLADILKAREAQHYEKATRLLAEARRKLDQGHLDEAEKLTYEAESLHPKFSLWYRGERPERLRAEIAQRRRQQRKPTLPPLEAADVARRPADATQPAPSQIAGDPQREKALHMLRQARDYLNRGDQRQALALALEVQKMQVPWQPGDDSPEAIIRAVEALHARSQQRDNPDAARAAHQQAVELLARARICQREGRLIDALELCRQAQQCRAAFHPDEDRPDRVMADLQRDCFVQIDAYTTAAQKLVQLQRYEEAEKYLAYVHALMEHFHLDNRSVAEQLAQVRAMVASRGSGSGSPADATAMPSVDEGRKLYAQAEQALARGDLGEARKLAEAVYTGPFNMKMQANQLLARIDAEEYRQEVARAQRTYELAMRAFRRGEYAVAASYLQTLDVRLLEPDKRQHVQEMITSREMRQQQMVAQSDIRPVDHRLADPAEPPAQVQVTDPKTPPHKGTDLIKEVQLRQAVELQKLREEKLKSEQEANRLAGQGDLDAAIQTLESAIVRVRNSELDPDRTAPLVRQLEERIRRFRTMREQIAFEKMQKEHLTSGRTQLERKFQLEEQKKEQVAELLKQYKTLYEQGKYKEAAVVAMKAREIDPDNVQADAAVWKANIMRNLSEEDRIKAQKEQGFVAAMQSVEESSIMMDDRQPIQYPEDWAVRDRRKQKTHFPVREPSPMDKEIYDKLLQPVSIDFRDKPLGQVLDELREMTGINIVPDRPALEQERISLAQPVTMRLDGVSMKTALRRILHDAQLTYVIQDGVLVVTTPQGERGKLVRVVYPVADLIRVGEGSALTTLGGTFISAGGSAWEPWTPGWHIPGLDPTIVSQSMANATGVPSSRSQKDKPLSPPPLQPMQDTLIALIKSVVDPMSWEDAGGPGRIEYFPIGMSLVVSQTPDVQEQIQQLLDRMRELQDLQVTVEVRIIELTEDFYERIGIDLNIDINDKQTQFDHMVATNTFAPPGYLNEPDHLEGVIVGLTPVQDPTLGLINKFTTDLDIPIRSSSFERATPPFGGFPNQPGRNGGLSMGVAFLSDIEVYLFMEAAQGDTRTNVMTAPKLTLFNGQTATISSTTFQFFTVQVFPITNFFTGATTFIPINQPFPSTFQLSLQAVVSADRRYVRLSLLPIITQVSAGGTFQPIPGITLQQPTINQFFVSTTVSVPDGGTILLGGIKRLSEGRNEFGPPILSKIPYINRLFRNTSYGRETRSLMLMVTPRIIIPEEEEERLGTFAM